MSCALVVGTADCMWDDWAHALDLSWSPGPIVVVNDAGWLMHDQEVDHWVTLHPEKLPDWEARRARTTSLPDDAYERWTLAGHEDRGGEVDHIYGEELDAVLSRGGSGLAALMVALEVADKAVLCGVPMDVRPHMRNVTSDGLFRTGDVIADHKRVIGYQWAWIRHAEQIASRVRSMSGWTADIFRVPSKQWMQHG